MKALNYKIISLFIVLIISIPAGYLLKEKAIQINLDSKFAPTSLHHPLGTDELGRDILARTICALGNSASIILIASLLSISFGITIGGIVGLTENKIAKYIFENTFNALWALPGIPLFVAILTYFPRNIISISLTISTLTWIVPARTIRFIIESEKRKLYVYALKSFGYPKKTILKFILYNIKESIIISTLFTILDIIITESTISFLGLGLQPPEPSLGSMIYNSLNYLNQAPLLFISPFLTLIFLLISLFLFISKTQEVSKNVSISIPV
jgi:peptide/nickel transport system permease protein